MNEKVLGSKLPARRFWSVLIIANNIISYQPVSCAAFRGFAGLSQRLQDGQKPGGDDCCSNVIYWSAQSLGYIILHCTWQLYEKHSSSADEVTVEHHVGSNLFVFVIRRFTIRVINAVVYERRLRSIFYFQIWVEQPHVVKYSKVNLRPPRKQHISSLRRECQVFNWCFVVLPNKHYANQLTASGDFMIKEAQYFDRMLLCCALFLSFLQVGTEASPPRSLPSR